MREAFARSALRNQGRSLEIDAVTLLSIYLFLLMAIPSRLIFAPLGGGGTPASILGIAFMGWYLILWLRPTADVDRQRQPVRVAAVLFFCTLIASYISANRHALLSVEQNGADRALIVAAGWIGVLLLAADCIKDMDRLRTFIRRIVFGASLIAILGVVQFFTYFDPVKYVFIPGLSQTVPYTVWLGFNGFPRPSATAIHPLEFAAVMGMTLPLAIHQARHAAPEVRLRRWLQVTLIAMAIPMTVSRTGILALAVALLVLIPTWPKAQRGWTYVVLIVGIVGLRAMVPGLVGTIRNLFLQIGNDGDTTSRTSGLSAAGGFIAQHPWFGRGFGTFVPQVYRFLDDQWLGSLIETGIIGFLALMALFCTGWSLGRRARRAFPDIESRDLAQALVASVAVAAVTFATFDALAFPMATGVTFLLLGCIGALWRLAMVSTTRQQHVTARQEVAVAAEPRS